MLQDRDCTAGEIAEAFDISKPSISHHFDILKQARLIRGKVIFYIGIHLFALAAHQR